eukprot:525481-Rhodomonas_salina.6
MPASLRSHASQARVNSMTISRRTAAADCESHAEEDIFAQEWVKTKCLPESVGGNDQRWSPKHSWPLIRRLSGEFALGSPGLGERLVAEKRDVVCGLGAR